MSVKTANANQIRKTVRKKHVAKPAARAQAAQADRLVLQRAVANPASASPADIQALQRAYGNRAVTGLIQAKLTVGPVGDRYEQEADRVAQQVMGMPTPVVVGQAGKGSQLAQRQAEEEEVQMKPARLGKGGLPLAASITPLVQRQQEEIVQRNLPEELALETPVIKHEEDGDKTHYKIVGKSKVFNTYTIEDTKSGEKIKNVSLKDAGWCVPNNQSQSRENWEQLAMPRIKEQRAMDEATTHKNDLFDVQPQEGTFEYVAQYLYDSVDDDSIKKQVWQEIYEPDVENGTKKCRDLDNDKKKEILNILI